MPIIEERARAIISVLDGNTIEADIISLSVSSAAVSGSAFSVGAVTSTQCNLQIKLENVNPYNLIGSTINLSVYKNGEWFEYGIYNISSCKRYKTIYTISACDNMVFFDVSAWRDVGGQKINHIAQFLRERRSPYQLLYVLCDLASVELANTQEEVEAMPNGTQEICIYTESHKNANVRDWLAWIAEILAGFAFINNQGKLEIRQFEMFSTAEFDEGNVVLDSSDVADYMADKFCIMLTGYDDWWFKSYTVTTERETLIEIDLTSNPLALGVYYIVRQDYTADEDIIQHMYGFLNNIWGAIGNLMLRPCNLKIASDIMCHAGQCITVPNTDGNMVNVLVTSHTWSLGEPQTIKCVGEDTRLISLTRQRSGLTRTAEELETGIETAKGISITQHDFNVLEDKRQLIEGQVYYIYE